MLNKVLLIGHVGQSPEIKTLNNGKEMAILSLATTERWKDKATGEKKDKTEWHRIVVFNEYLVPVVKKYVKKGSKIYIDGQLSTRKWTDEAGVDHYATEINLKNGNHALVLLDKQESSSRPPAESYEE